MKKYEELVKFIIKNIGGKNNILNVTHCVTRLRFQLKDESKANDEALKNNSGIINRNALSWPIPGCHRQSCS